MEYWREGSTSTAISTTFASDIVGQHNKIGGINFGAALVCVTFIVTLTACFSQILKLYQSNTTVYYSTMRHIFRTTCFDTY